MIPVSVLDLAPIIEGADVRDALLRSRDLAQHAEAWGYRRFWLAEHHNMPGIARPSAWEEGRGAHECLQKVKLSARRYVATWCLKFLSSG